MFGLTTAAFGGLALASGRFAPVAPRRVAAGYGPLRRDPAGVLDLPDGFDYRVVSRVGERMQDGFVVPDNFDGMGSFALDARRVLLVRNHELRVAQHEVGALAGRRGARVASFDHDGEGRPLPGGTTNLVYDTRTGEIESQHLTLLGTIRNCAGGTTPWGSWLSCEEDVTRAGEGVDRDHGWVFEVPATATGPVEPRPLKDMGRFNHEAAAVDPRSGIVYLTEDRDDSLFYRFLPAARGELARGGRLQALALATREVPADARNWSGRPWDIGAWHETRWIDLDEVESPADDLRLRGHAAGAVRFARGEGIHYGDGEFFFCCTSGGAAGYGQVMRYRPSPVEGHPGEKDAPGRVQVFVESADADMFNFGDNLTVAPNGHLVVCEDQYTEVVVNRLIGVTPDGSTYPLGFLHAQTELAGACFSPDGGTLFVNLYSPGRTLAIRGPWTTAPA
nr:alkaline phosphatase PhoX [Coralloluteibacterium stylophorae]